MTWFEAVPALLAATALAYAPGALVAAVLRLPALPGIAAAPVFSLLILGVSALATGAFGLEWGWPAAAVALAAFLVGAATLRWLRPTPDRTAPAGEAGAGTEGELRRRESRAAWQYPAGVGIAAAVLGPWILGALNGPNEFSQRFDTVFHLNAVQYVASTGAASPFEFGPIGSPSFYPAVWHEWAGLLVQLTGVPVTVAVQVCTVVTVFLIWPLGLAWLVDTLFRLGAVGRLAVGPLAFASSAMPFGLISWGTFYANLLGFAMAPVAIAAGWEALGRRRVPALRLWQAMALAAAAFLAVGLSHPNAALGAGLVLAPAALGSLVRALRPAGEASVPSRLRRSPNRRGEASISSRRRGSPIRGSWPWTVGVGAAVVAFVLAWTYSAIRLVGREQDAFMGLPQAVRETVTGSALGNSWTPALTFGFLAGVFVAWRRPHLRPLLAAYAIAQFLYLERGLLGSRGLWSFPLAPFYNDPHRIAAVVAMVTVPLAVLGWDWGTGTVLRWVRERLGRGRPGRETLGRGRPGVRARGLGRTVPVAFSAVLALSILVSPGAREEMDKVDRVFQITEESPILTPEERALIERIPEHVLPGYTIVVDPWAGGAMVYALTGRAVTLHYMPEQPEPRIAEINERLNRVAVDDDICAALAREAAAYVIELEPERIPSVFDPPEYPGLHGLDRAEGFTLLDSEGESALYRITACYP